MRILSINSFATLVFLIFTFLFITVLTVVPVDAFKAGLVGAPPVHQQINQNALAFLKTDVHNVLAEQHTRADLPIHFSRFVNVITGQWVPGFYLSNRYHFDNCYILESINNINEHYRNALRYLNPHNPNHNLAQAEFGLLLHTVQDFYAHSNWVELGKRTLFDNHLDMWPVLVPGDDLSDKFPTYNGVMILEGEDSGVRARGYQLSIIGPYNVMVTAPNGNRIPGLVTGDAALIPVSPDECPDSVTFEHGSDRGLNKDEPIENLKKERHSVARSLATKQTAHEFCRLGELVKTAYGEQAKESFLNNWVANKELVYNTCRNLVPPVQAIPIPGGEDRIPPDTQITSVFTAKGSALHNGGTTPSNEIIFNFRGSDNTNQIGYFECRLISPSSPPPPPPVFRVCGTYEEPVSRPNLGNPIGEPRKFTGLSPGEYIFEVKSIDMSTNHDPTPASFSWRVTAPTMKEGFENQTSTTMMMSSKQQLLPPTEPLASDEGPVIASISAVDINGEDMFSQTNIVNPGLRVTLSRHIIFSIEGIDNRGISHFQCKLFSPSQIEEPEFTNCGSGNGQTEAHITIPIKNLEFDARAGYAIYTLQVRAVDKGNNIGPVEEFTWFVVDDLERLIRFEHEIAHPPLNLDLSSEIFSEAKQMKEYALPEKHEAIGPAKS